ncbi:MAG: type IVB secretion system lipoprotein DotD [Legionellaceae bacterium]|nr:type IVB secretion system lipoprotein DotD [Legionellaceae bacterium]
MKKITLSVVVFLCLGACSPTYKKPPVNAPSTDATIQIAEAADNISHSMEVMERVDKAMHPPSPDNIRRIPSSYNLQTRASVDWAGPIEEITARIAKAADYHFIVMGKKPTIPVLINLNVQEEMLVSILRDLDYQARTKASIHVYPNRRVIELRYEHLFS